MVWAGVVSPMVSAVLQLVLLARLLVWVVVLELPPVPARVSLVLEEKRTKSGSEQWRLSVSLSSPPLLGFWGLLGVR